MTDSLWQDVLTDLEKTMTGGTFSVFLGKTEFVSFEDGTLIISVPNVFIQSSIGKKCDDDIKKALNVYGIVPTHIEYIVKKSSNKKMRDDTSIATVVSKKSRKPKVAINNGLNPRYQFGNFIVGSSNDLAYTACQTVVKSPGTKYNPLFLYGGSGLGKTHLMQAVGNKVLSEHPDTVVLYTTVESFYKDFIDSLRFKTTGFSDRYRNVDVLLIDDIQFIIGKEKSQDEFFHTFNTLHQNNKQIIISSDRPPKEFTTLADRFRTRFEWGMTIDIQFPDFETRCAIIEAKATESGKGLPSDVIEYLATNIKTSIRELEGSLNHLLAVCDLQGIEPDLSFTEGLLSSQSNAYRPRYLTAKQVINKTAQYFQINPKDMCSKDRSKHIAEPRQIAMYFLRSELHLSYPNIGKEFSRDHSTVMHSVEKIETSLKSDYLVREQVNEIREKLYA